MSSKAFGDETKTTQTCYCLVDKTMNMYESYLTKTYLRTSGASSCRCVGIAGRELYPVLRKYFGSSVGKGAVAEGRGEREQENEAAEMVFRRQMVADSADNVFSGTISNDAGCNGFGTKKLATGGTSSTSPKLYWFWCELSSRRARHEDWKDWSRWSCGRRLRQRLQEEVMLKLYASRVLVAVCFG